MSLLPVQCRGWIGCRRGVAGRGFSLREMFVVLAIVAILVSILVPWVVREREQAATVKCAETLRSLGQCLWAYDSAYRRYPLSYYTSNPAPAEATPTIDDAKFQNSQYPWWQLIWCFTRPSQSMDNSTGWVRPPLDHAMFCCPSGKNPTGGLSYAPNPVIMPDLAWEQARMPRDKSFTNPVIAPVRSSDMSMDSALLWDATEIPPASTMQAVVGYQVDNNPNAAADATNTLMEPAYPSYRFRDDKGLYKGNPALGDDYPIYVYSDQVSASCPPPMDAEGVNDADTTHAKALGVPCWRHNGGTACNFLMGDGSVKTVAIRWTGDANAPWTCELMRRQLRIKWPAGFSLYQGH